MSDSKSENNEPVSSPGRGDHYEALFGRISLRDEFEKQSNVKQDAEKGF